jgi:hypothetical protein
MLPEPVGREAVTAFLLGDFSWEISFIYFFNIENK